jgi:hypothetical protein
MLPNYIEDKGILENKMFLIEFSGSQCVITSYNSSSGTLTTYNDFYQITIPKTSIIIKLDKQNYYNSIIEDRLTLFNKNTKLPLAIIKDNTLDTNSTSYSNNLVIYANNIQTLINS